MELLKKNIWLVNHYAMPPKFESRLRTIKFAQYLTDKGYNVTIISSSFLHNMNKNLIEDGKSFIEKEYGKLKFIHIKTIGYNKNGLARFYNLFQFHFKLFFLRNKFSKPNIIVHTALPPFGNIIYLAAKKLNAKYIAEVLDLWPESFVDLGVMKKVNPFIQFSYLAERWLYKKASSVVFSMEGGKQYIIDKKWDINNGGPIDLNKIFYINNGVDLCDFEKHKNCYRIEDSDLLDVNTKKVIYIGSIRLANNLKELINAALVLKDHKDIKFLLYGDGDDRNYLINYCYDNNITNVVFKEKWVEPQYVPFILSQSDLNILNYKSEGFGKYGGSQSKLFQYMASGKPICSNINMMYCPINKYNLGIAKIFSSNKEYSEAIISLLSLEQKEKEKLQNRINEVVNNFDYKVLTNKLIEIF